ncbi:hypothetical protein C8035_v007254 [Colletotrichum spinosum]|uniref:Uncharacterized protein n=1 Tax=Colletotrichum spinosum TaxID=1347390 RepID=A0A4R8QHL5_9PEZI|nr:hypothetical protein C8035_v007254 [Colletotrichum spinosum]
MSLFGDDFFSNPEKLAGDAPPMPALNPNHAAYSSGNTPSLVTPEPKSLLSSTITTPQRAESPREPEQAERKASVSPARHSPASESPKSALSDLPSQRSRPSIPGGWVTETRSVNEVPTPPAVAEKKIPTVDSGNVSPISENEDDERRGSGTVTVKDRVSIPVSIPEASQRASLTQRHAADKGDADITPLAPLNPRPSDNSPSAFVAPEKLQRESTMSTMASPSPVKESDKLREEIMRSLSPVRPTGEFGDLGSNNNNSNNNHLRTPAHDDEDMGPRESTYLHGVYDDYWTAGDDKSDMADLPSKADHNANPAAASKLSDVPPLSPRKDASGTPPTLGRRFSWEAGSEQVTPGPNEVQQNPLADSQTTAFVIPSPAQIPPAAQFEDARATEHAQPSTTTDESRINVPRDSGTVSHQVSQVSSVPRDRLGSEAIEPPSPVSDHNDKNTSWAAAPGRLSLAEEKSMVRVASNPVSPSPPPGDHPALAQSSEASPPPASPEPSLRQPSTPVKMANFRDIMELPSASDRIAKYNETRAQFAVLDSGLNDWLVNLKAQQPEHANATASFAANAASVGQSQPSPTASQPSSQQPYYQQYLNASSSNVNQIPSGRSPGSNAPLGSSPGSDFKHSSGQVGAKGKGLLLAAGKAGKGLLSKGKSKLRGTGDKTIPEHPASQTPPPQLPQTSRTSPIETLTQGTHKRDSVWAPPRPQTPKRVAGVRSESDSEPVSPVSETQVRNQDFIAGDGADYSGGDLQVPKPISKIQPSWDPFTGTPLVEEEGFEMGRSRDPSPQKPGAAAGAAAAGQPQAAATSRNIKNDEHYDDWVVVSPQSPPSGHVYLVSPESPQLRRSFQPAETTREISATEDEPNRAISQGVLSYPQQVQPQGPQPQQQLQQQQAPQQVQYQAQQPPNQDQAQQAAQQQAEYPTRHQLPSQQQQQQPQRQSSFVGLPPIRRSSTFGVNLTRRAKKRFSLDEDDDEPVFVSSPVGTFTEDHFKPDAPGPSHIQQAQPYQQASHPARIQTGLTATRQDSHQVASATSTQAATLATESTGVDWRIGDEKRPLDPKSSFRPGGPVPDPINTQLATQNDGRHGGPGMRSQQGMMPSAFGGNPIQHLPPQGPWKLEESHLSEPLATSRNRGSGSASPATPYFGFDKETGMPSPTAPRQETQLPPRQKFSEVPPSSAQRYPGLFTSPPQGYPGPTSPNGPRGSSELGRQLYSRDNSLQRTRTADSEVSSVEPSGDEERGRKRGSGFFKEIGGRFSRTSSREPHNFKDETEPLGQPHASDVRGDEVSEASVATGDFQERGRRRSSMFLNLRGSRPSDAGVAQVHDGDGATPSPKASPKPVASPMIHEPPPTERKRSLLGPLSNESSPGLPDLSYSSTSTGWNEGAGPSRGPPKKRFSGLGKVFTRSATQQELLPPPKPGTSHSAMSFHSNHSGASMNQPGQQAQGRERSNTTGSGPFFNMQPNKHLQPVGEEDRGRRSSAGGFFSGLFGRSAKNQDAHPMASSGQQQVVDAGRQSPMRLVDGKIQFNEDRTAPPAQTQASAPLALGVQGLDYAGQPTDQPMSPQASAATREPLLSASVQQPSVSAPSRPPVNDQAQAPAPVNMSHGQHRGPVSQQYSHPQFQGPPTQNPRIIGERGQGQQFQQPHPNQTTPPPFLAGQIPHHLQQSFHEQDTADPGSKWFRNRSATQPAPPQPKQNQPKQSTAKALLNAFKRSSKQPEARSQQPHQAPHPQSFQMRQGQQRMLPPGQQGQRGPGPQQMQGPHVMYQQQRPPPGPLVHRPHHQHAVSSASSDISQGSGAAMTRALPAMPQPQPYVEPRYDQVPIPQGYAAVHGEGGVAPSPYDIGRPSPPAQNPQQQLPPMQQQTRGQPTAQRHPSDMTMYSQQPQMPQSQHPQNLGQAGATLQGDRRISATSYQSDTSQAMASHTGFPGHAGSVPGYGPKLQPQDSRSMRLSQNSGSDIMANSQAYHHEHPQVSPQPSQQSIQQRLSPANIGGHAAPPQVQPSLGGGSPEPSASHTANLVQAQPVVANETTPTGAAPQPRQSRTASQNLVVDTGIDSGNSRSPSPSASKNVADNVKPEPEPEPAPAPARLSVNVQKANQEAPDDIYDSTPRLPPGPMPPAAKPLASSRTGDSQVSESSADEAPRNATHTNGNANGKGTKALTHGKSTRAELEDTEDERMRTMRLEAQEEKILVDPYEEKQSSGNKFRKEDDPEAPQMSATSYPGQEWNPYGAGGYDEWD